MDPIAILGATGYVGGRLAPNLLRAGYSVRCLVRSPEKLNEREWTPHPKVKIRRADLADAKSLSRGLGGCSAAYYLVHSMLAAGAEYAKKDLDLGTPCRSIQTGRNQTHHLSGWAGRNGTGSQRAFRVGGSETLPVCSQN